MPPSIHQTREAAQESAQPTWTPARVAVALLTVGIGTFGALVFHAFGMPAAFLTGSAAAVAVALVAGVPVTLPNAVRSGSFSVLGTVMGSSISLAALEQLVTAPVALIGLVLVVVGTSAASAAVLYWLGGWDRLSALCGSIPGNLPLVLAVSTEGGARMDRVVMAQSLRLFILVALIPFVFGGSDASDLEMAPDDIAAFDVAFTLALTAGAVALAYVARIPAPALMGPLIAGAAMSVTGLARVAIPDWMAAFALVMLGTSVALRFRGVQREGLARMFVASLGAFVAAASVSLVLAVAFAAILARPVGTVFFAYAPGGIDTMIALSFLLNYDVAFVALIHTARMILLSLSLPPVIALLGRRWRNERSIGE
ncbi:AbrB family transcriptional regulator [Acuticoccus sp. I52.16.1]|uniref:AbrB family transcriptional regulator n=1 Tax=Acuticoccus sp. I52.16.1 TaxID=2928472 RepID=UPI001FD60B74|nr:AbrB family transcriptional regulator [Acuticoccus sp. I52.16.1]UOM35156.1 AbrB family transcriptional regulator [Acuticoccus sp. I52.16.1]